MFRLIAFTAVLAVSNAADPQCYTGIGGSNSGPSCESTQAYDDNKVEDVNCNMRAVSNMCVENNEGGMGDGCPTDDAGNKRDTEESCTSYRAGDRNADESFDGTTNHCRWVPQKTDEERSASCEADSECKFYADRGEQVNGVAQGNCATSDSAMAKMQAWEEKRGDECEKRLKSGCLENNDWMGETDECTNQETSETCGSVAQLHGNECTDHVNGQTKPKPCCQWIPAPANPAQACATKGAGTLKGMCAYGDGQGPPSPRLASAGFEHGMFRLGGAAFNNKCALVATFQDGKGAAVAFGANTADLVGVNCKSRAATWKDLAEHIGHDDDSIAEYCDNFVPDASAMEAFKKHSPGEIIAAAKSGQFATLFPGLKDELYVVTSNPAYGECLFTQKKGVFGAAICTCDEAECNGQDALEFITDRDVGPMRLLQFIDGSLLDMKEAINAVVDGLITADGKINIAKVDAVTETDVDNLMKLSGMGDLTNKAELLALIEDYRELNANVGGSNTNTGGMGGMGDGNGDGMGMGTGMGNTDVNSDEPISAQNFIEAALEALGTAAGTECAASNCAAESAACAADADCATPLYAGDFAAMNELQNNAAAAAAFTCFTGAGYETCFNGKMQAAQESVEATYTAAAVAAGTTCATTHCPLQASACVADTAPKGCGEILNTGVYQDLATVDTEAGKAALECFTGSDYLTCFAGTLNKALRETSDNENGSTIDTNSGEENNNDATIGDDASSAVSVSASVAAAVVVAVAGLLF